ncbi:MAG: DUF1343 domain-containing protein [Rhodothermales bacterium]|nr:DUF1343 domain-containing protein [Rhodothermales bacterium]
MIPLALFLLLLAPMPSGADTTRVRTGAQVLVDADFAPLLGAEARPGAPLRVGLVTNPTAVVDTSDGGPAHLIDRLAAHPAVALTALFAPEHGLRGRAEAGETVVGGEDVETGIPVISLYGGSKKPPPEALADLDLLLFDIQDVGARFYTYVSTMGYAMQAAAEAGVPFVVLDRPNPLGGVHVSGFVREPAQRSFVGLYPVPIQHGLTAGELARMIQGEGWLDGLDRLDLRVVEMDGWRRAMLWPDTGLPFTPTSPNIPDFETALVYPGTALLEGTTASEGRGTDAPFLTVGAPWADADALADALNTRGLPGVRFEPVRFTPRDLPGRASNPKGEGEAHGGVRLVVEDPEGFYPVEAGIHVLHALHAQRPAGTPFFLPEWLSKMAGTRRFQTMVEGGMQPEHLVQTWQEEVAAFEQAREPYLLYD